MTEHQHGYLIHKSGRGWYRPKAKGYTLIANEAGRFSLADAVDYTHPNGPDGLRDGLTYAHETTVAPGTNCETDLRIHDLTLERDQLLRVQEELSRSLAAALAEIETLKIQISATDQAIDRMASLHARAHLHA